MEMERGCVVRSLMGRDKGRFLVVSKSEAGKVYVCDGKERPVERPKAKNPKHLSMTKTKLSQESLETNRGIRAGLHGFNYPEAKTEPEKY